jgi:hypothetical protein
MHNMFPRVMETLTAGSGNVYEASMRLVDEADLYVCILAERYGTVDPERGKSYTHLELERAVERGMNVVVLMTERGPEGSDQAPLTEDIRDLREWADKQSLGVKFSSVDNMGWKLSTALADWDRRGAWGPPPGTRRPAQRVVEVDETHFEGALAKGLRVLQVDSDQVETAVLSSFEQGSAGLLRITVKEPGTPVVGRILVTRNPTKQDILVQMAARQLGLDLATVGINVLWQFGPLDGDEQVFHVLVCPPEFPIRPWLHSPELR